MSAMTIMRFIGPGFAPWGAACWDAVVVAMSKSQPGMLARVRGADLMVSPGMLHCSGFCLSAMGGIDGGIPAISWFCCAPRQAGRAMRHALWGERT
ncbi:hypothetical protein, partial [Paraburkholderia sp. JHI869]|uniref:hypothetical protein n=1 Tax=Paraburkholderia sp. JHI869 TaxID=3112959 RepID=UPI00317BA67A